jgi:glycine oxidase
MGRIAMVGGGIIGLACAWRLQRLGHAVTLFDGAPAAREASWAAAGMLAPHHEAEATDARWQFMTEGLARWRGWADELGGAQAIDVRFNGGLLPIVDPADESVAQAKAAWLVAAGVEVNWQTGAELRALAPGLAPSITKALRLPAGQVDPRRACDRLVEGLNHLGADLRYGEPVLAVERHGQAVTGIQTTAGFCPADEVILASGAWTPELARLAGIQLSGRPVKGQLVRFAQGAAALESFVHSHHVYLVPRRDGSLVVGATMVETGFDRGEDAAAIATLAASARRLIPALESVPLAETWTGLRPQLDGGPVIRRLGSGLIIATGHFRNGILLAPLTAERVAAIVG